MDKPLNATQQALLAKLTEHGRFVRYPGGFWAAPGLPTDAWGVPPWHFGTVTINALLKKGVIKAVEKRKNFNGTYVSAVSLGEEQ